VEADGVKERGWDHCDLKSVTRFIQSHILSVPALF
jgi:hypothetical protein